MAGDLTGNKAFGLANCNSARCKHLCVFVMNEPGLLLTAFATIRTQFLWPRKKPILWMSVFLGDLTSINLEHLFGDLFKLRDNFKELGMDMHDGVIFFPDLI